ncbi:MAG TPA: tetratricopeptide repeat protein [Bryobacteraceae bacterium]|nr:tetratricopeptide repeat protein [Bryobacteraceae bacterium]
MIHIRKLVLSVLLSTTLPLSLYASDQAFTDMEVYLQKPQPEKGFSLSADAERFRSYAQADKAYRLIQAGKLDLARQELVPLVEHSPEDARAGSLYVLVLYRLRDFAEVIRQANLMLTRQPHFIPALLYRSRAYLAAAQLNEAIAGFEMLEHQPELKPADRISTLATIAELCIRTKDYSRASSAATKLLALDKSYEAWFRKGIIEDGLGAPGEAERAYRSALMLANTPAQRLEAHKAIAECLRKQKSWQPARDALLLALAVDPRDVSSLRSLAQTDYQLRDYPEAEKHLRRLLALTGTEPRPEGSDAPNDQEFLANLLLLRKDWPHAQVEFAAVLSAEKHPSVRARVYRALSQIAENTGDGNQSVEYLKSALALGPSFDGREKLANLLIRQEKIAEADSEFTALAREARSAEDKHRLLMMLGEVKMSGERYREAVEVFADAARINADASTLQAASNAAERAGDLQAAADFSRRAAVQVPSAEAHLRLGTLQKASGNLEQAIASFEMAARESATPSQKVEVYKAIAFVCVSTKDYEQARRAFDQALAFDPHDAGLHRYVAGVLVQMKEYADAVPHFEQAIAMDEKPDDRRSLASAQDMAGQLEAATTTYSELLRRLPAEEKPDVYLSLAEVERKRGHEAKAADVYRDYLATPNLRAVDRARALESLGQLYSKLHNKEAAADSFARAIDTGAASASIYEDLGFLLYDLGRWRPALDAFLAAPSSEGTPTRLIAIANCYWKLDKPGLAIHYLDQALQQQEGWTSVRQRQAYADLGYLYADAHDYRHAIEAWQNAQHLQNTPDLGLRLARLERLAGDANAALKELGQIRRADLITQDQAQYFDELAQIDAQQGKLEDSRHAWESANRIESSTARNYEIGSAYLKAGLVGEAIPYLERAAKPSGNKLYIQSLAYAYKSAGRLNEAVACFEQVATPGSIEVYKELAYLEMRQAHNASAEQWFRKAFEAEPQPQALREDFARLTNRYTVTLYDGYSSDPQVQTTAFEPAPGPNTVTPAGGGIELDFQPPGIGFRNERTLQVFTRATWSNEPDSLSPQRGSKQMGLGVRYKPLISQNLQLSLERFIPLSSGLQQNWMARAMSSWSAGYDLKPDQKGWNYSLLFIDTALLLQAPRTAAEFAQFRQGITFRAGQSLLITPHLLAAARHQSPIAAAGTYLEAGGGLSLRFLLRDSYDLPRKSSFELLFDCHRGSLVAQAVATGYHGCRASGILRF